MKNNIDDNIPVIDESGSGGRNKTVYQHVQGSEEPAVKQKRKLKIRIIGIGSGIQKSISRLAETGFNEAELIAATNYPEELLNTKIYRKVLIGKRMIRGLGGCTNPIFGEEGAKSSAEELKDILKGSDIVLIAATLGGSIGSGAAPVVAEISKNLGALTMALVTMPFNIEGSFRYIYAKESLEKLTANADIVIAIAHDDVRKIVPDTSIDLVFKVADEILMETMKNIVKTITVPGLVNIDYADMKTIIAGDRLSMIGIGESEGSMNRVQEAVDDALNSPLIEGDIASAAGAILMIVGDTTLSVSEAQKAAQLISMHMNPHAKLIWGASIDPELKNLTRVFVIFTGMRNPFSVGVKVKQ